jgi:parallel beta-helix repeat protein
MKQLLFACAVLAVLAVPALAQGQKPGKVLRVPSEFNTIQRALDETDPGDTVFVDEGTYKESITMRDDVVLTGVSAERTILVGDRRKPVIKGAQGSTVRNVTIENGQMGILAANAVMTIENCVIRGNRGSGVHCLISLPVIQNNILFRNAWSGIFCETTRSHKGHISNNVVVENNYSGINLAGQSEALVENNVFYFNKQYGVFTAEGARKSRITGNVFYGNRQPGNAFSVIDRSNRQEDPGYTVFSATGHMFWDRAPETLKGKGRDGKDIGATKRPPYKPSAAKPAPQAKPATPAPASAPAKAEKKAPVAVDTVKTEKAVTDSAKADEAVAGPPKSAVPADAVKTEPPDVDSTETE